MALVNHQRKFIYVMEPHMASRATVEAVRKYVAGTGDVGHHHIRLDQLCLRDRQHLDPRQIKGYTIICTVRNPFDTMVTRWRQGALKDIPISEKLPELEEDHPILFPSRGMERDADIIIMYEDLQNDLQWAFRQPQLELGYDPNHKTPGKAHWTEYFDQETFDTLYNRPDWQRYMKHYGYRISLDGTVELDMNTRIVNCKQLA